MNIVGLPKSDCFKIVAIEMAASAENTEAILDNHAHEYLGERKSVAAAKRVAKKYVTAWFAKRMPKSCPCGPIASDA